MPWLDLQEDISEMFDGLIVASDRDREDRKSGGNRSGDGFHLTRFNTTRATKDGSRFRLTEAQREENRACLEKNRRAYKTAKQRGYDGSSRPYRRHPPGTPAWKKQDLDKLRARRRQWMRDNRIREGAKEKRMAKKTAFLTKLEGAGLVFEAKLICVGRALGEVNAIPDPTLLLGPDPDHLAARIDFACFLVHPLRGWGHARIADLFGVSSGQVRKWLASRGVGVDGLPGP